MPEAIAATKTSDGSCLDDNSCGSLSSYTISNESSTLCSDSDANKSLLSNIQGDNTLGEMSQEESTLNGGTTVDSSTIGESSGSVSMESSSVYTSLISGDSSTSSTQEDDEEEEDNTTISSITSPNFTRHPPIESSCEVSNVRDRSNNSDGSRSLFQHHALSTPPAPQPSMEPVDSITSRLLGLRGSPPGTLCSLAESEIKLLCQRVRPVLLNQQMLLELEAPLKICGDIHGQFTDLLRLFEYGGFPPEANYLFLGDYVDRGKQSLETICLLFCYKIKYPENFSILRGNHESAGINRIYGFYDECKRRYSIKLWKIFCDCFNCLPVSAIVDEKILCMHGGLSPEMHSLQQIADLPRPCDVPDVGLMCDLLWSDPDANINVSSLLFFIFLISNIGLGRERSRCFIRFWG